MLNRFNAFRPFPANIVHLSVAATVASLVFTLAGRADDWPCWRGPNRDGISKEAGWLLQWPAEGPKQLWKASVGTGFATVSVSKGRVYTMGNQNNTDTIYCLDAVTGTVKWKHSYECKLAPDNFEGGPCSTPTVDGDAVYTFSRFGHAFALDAEKGSVIWSKNLLQETGAQKPQWGLAGSVLVEGDRAFFNVGSAGTALDKATGKMVWTSGKEAAGYSTAVAYGQGSQRGLALFVAKAVVGVNPADGQKLWEHPWKTSYDVNAADPIVLGDRVFISSGYGRGCALLQITGGQAQTLWENKNMRNQFANSVLVGDSLYGFDGNTGGGELKCLDLKTGAVKWAQKGLTTGGLMAADGKLILLADGGKLVVAEASPAGFTQLAGAKPLSGKCWTMPVLANGSIYCRNAKGDLVCLDVKAK